jgi:hypothetical protein
MLPMADKKRSLHDRAALQFLANSLRACVQQFAGGNRASSRLRGRCVLEHADQEVCYGARIIGFTAGPIARAPPWLLRNPQGEPPEQPRPLPAIGCVV